MSIEKRKDGELGSLFWLSILFGGVLLVVACFYSAWDLMPQLWQIIGYIFLGINAGLITLIFLERKDPNYDKYRKIFCVLAVLTMAYIAGFKVASNENNAVIEDSNAAKQEQLK